MFYTYILRSQRDGKRYIGYSSDVKTRLKFHNDGLNPSTKNRRPLKLVCFKIFDRKLFAIRYETYLKSLKGGRQLNAEINNILSDANVAQLVEQLHGKE